MSDTKQSLNVGLITGGGDCPGLNSAINGLVKTMGEKHKVVGFYGSWNGLVNNHAIHLDAHKVDDIAHQGGTILKSSKSFPLQSKTDLQKIDQTLKQHNIDVLTVIGGDSTLFVAGQIHKQLNHPMMGIPKTIDNDIPHNDYSIGFMSAVETVCQSIEQVKSSAKSHNRAMVIEVMGRHTGSLTAYAGLASGCDIILVPEHPVRLDALKKDIQTRFNKQNKKHLLIAVAEGAVLLNDQNQAIQMFEQDQSFQGMSEKGGIRYGGIAEFISEWMNSFISWDARPLVLGHLQRGGAPIAMDRVLAFALGSKAAQLIMQKNFNQAVCLKNGAVVHMPMNEIYENNQEQQKPLSEQMYQLCKISTAAHEAF